MDYPNDKEVLETFDCMQKIVFRFVDAQLWSRSREKG